LNLLFNTYSKEGNREMREMEGYPRLTVSQLAENGEIEGKTAQDRDISLHQA
jgi:hypothetical protein